MAQPDAAIEGHKLSVSASRSLAGRNEPLQRKSNSQEHG
jgi:hypothetical protein